MPKYLFFDVDQDLINAYSQHLGQIDGVECIIEDVTQLGLKRQIDVLISPANSKGWMSGGIDGVYSRMFDDIQGIVQQAIAQCGYPETFRGAPDISLPVGSALMVPIRHLPGQPKVARWMISAPTMKWPRDLRNSPKNIYYCMLAIIHLTQNLPPDTVVAIPGLGTGVGALSGDVSGAQIAKAFKDFNDDEDF